MPLKIDKDIIEDRLKSIFPTYKFDMSNYTNTHCKIALTCPKHGESLQNVKNLLKGHGCNKCGNDIISNKQRNKLSDVLGRFRDKHGDRYDYSKFKYKNNRTPSTIICYKHGEFKQNSRTHSMGHGCPMCSMNKRLTNSEFIKRSKDAHTIDYGYDLVDYKNMHSKVIIQCPTHGPYEQIPLHHIKGVGCPTCNQSKGERMIESFLKKNNIDYKTQVKFDECFHIGKLPFDFYLPKYKTCIEFNGIQHYYPIDIFGGKEALKLNKIRDNIKSKFCKENNIKLIIIKQDKKHIDIDDVNNQINNILNHISESNNHMKYLNDYRMFEYDFKISIK